MRRVAGAGCCPMLSHHVHDIRRLALAITDIREKALNYRVASGDNSILVGKRQELAVVITWRGDIS